jgi:hypothetical protein
LGLAPAVASPKRQKIRLDAIEMLDLPEILIVLLTTLLVVLWTRHWMIHRRAGQTKERLRDTGPQPPPRSRIAKDA